MMLHALKKERTQLLDRADVIINGAEANHRPLTVDETRIVDVSLARAKELAAKIADVESKNTIRKMVDPETGAILFDPPKPGMKMPTPQIALSEEYRESFLDYVRSGGQTVKAVLSEGGGGPSGGYIVPSLVSPEVVPLAVPEMAVRQLAMVIPTSMDIKVPRKGAFGQASAKAEGSAFTEVDPTLEQFTLSAFMSGIQETVSWELLQDVNTFQAFVTDDMISACLTYEEAKYISGTGSGEPEGLLGNVGTGVTGVVAGTDNYASELLDATFDVMGDLKGVYHANASWLMSRATSIVLRKAQKQANLFEQVFSSQNGQDYLHGYPVRYSDSMPDITAGNTPVLFGNFKAGYVIGDRGGSGIFVKVLDQPKAQQGQIVLLAYRRSDGRVRRSEAIQSITLHT